MPDKAYKVPGTGETRYRHITSSQQKLISDQKWQRTVANAKREKAMTIAQLIEKYPVRNEIWMAHDDGSFSAEDSTLSGNNARTDPWNRPLPSTYQTNKNREHEITHWTFKTTVAGQSITLTIWND